ncbi:MAG: histidine kinase [Pseudomonadota bacterium]
MSGALTSAATSMERILNLQSVGLLQGIGLEPRYIDWYPLTQVSLPEATCVRLIRNHVHTLHRTCRGRHYVAEQAPRWFVYLYQTLVAKRQPVVRTIGRPNESLVLEIVTDRDAELTVTWEKLGELIAPSALVIFVLCATLWWSARNALSPTGKIMRGLSAIEQGNFGMILGPFGSYEFDRIATATNHLTESLRTAQNTRIELTRQIFRIQEEERLAIAHELHDEFGQHLTAISANAASLQSATGSFGAQRELANIEKSARHLHATLRSLLVRIRPWAGDADIKSCLVALAREVRELSHRPLRIDFADAPLPESLPGEINEAVYRIAQEALTNAIRHSSAREITIDLRVQDSSMLELVIADDGGACDLTKLEGGFGIKGIQERVRALNGETSFTINSRHGLTLHARLPLALALADNTR